MARCVRCAWAGRALGRTMDHGSRHHRCDTSRKKEGKESILHALQAARSTLMLKPHMQCGVGFFLDHEQPSLKGPTSVAMMAQQRYEASINHNNKLKISWPGLTPRHRVFASITEVGAQDVPWLGDARMSVYNVVPQHDYVVVWVDVAWDNPLRVFIDLLTVDPVAIKPPVF